jgi:hypothetical protein
LNTILYCFGTQLMKHTVCSNEFESTVQYSTVQYNTREMTCKSHNHFKVLQPASAIYDNTLQ